MELGARFMERYQKLLLEGWDPNFCGLNSFFEQDMFAPENGNNNISKMRPKY